MNHQPKVQSATSIQLSPEADRHARMIKYTVAMSIRMVCFVLAILVPGWGHVIFGIGAITLPYIAVVLANAGSVGAQQAVGVVPQIRALEAAPSGRS